MKTNLINLIQNHLKVFWLLNGSKIQTNSRAVEFESLTEEQNGKYECIAYNEYGTTSRAFTINLSDEPKRREANFSITVKIISDPFFLRSFRNLKLKCISDMPDAVYIWSMVNGTLRTNLRVRNDILIFKPFTNVNAGSYECTVYSGKSGRKISRRVHLRAEANSKKVLDVSDRIRIEVLSEGSVRLGEGIQLRCSVNDVNLRVVWLMQCGEFVRRVAAQEYVLDASVVTFRRFGAKDGGTYKCRAFARQPQRHRFRVIGEAAYSLTSNTN